MASISNEWSRRKFIFTLSGASAALLFNPFTSWASTFVIDPEIAKIVSETIGIDTHNHIDVPLIKSELPGPKVDLYGEMIKSGLSAIVMTFAVDYQKLNTPGEAYERFLNGLTAMDAILKSNHMMRSFSFSDLEEAHKLKRPTVIQAVEGAHFLEGEIERLEVAYNRGLRHLGLLHDNDASEPLGDIFTNPPKWGGLTKFGADVIKECERLGILVDLSHCDNATVNAALKIATKPILISHTGLNTRLGKKEFMAKMMMPRLISKEQAKIVAEAGGVIGVWTHLADTATEFAENVKALVEIVGVDHVAIGTDTKLTPAYRSPGEKWQQANGHNPEQKEKSNSENKQDENSHKESEFKSENGGKHQGGDEHTTNTIWPESKEGFYYQVVENLLKAGFTQTDIKKIAGGNYCRIFDIATKGN